MAIVASLDLSDRATWGIALFLDEGGQELIAATFDICSDSERLAGRAFVLAFQI